MTVKLERQAPGKAIYQLVMEARECESRARRSESRCPFFRPVSIDVGGRRLSAFSRDLSNTGIGLQHNFELPLGDLEITISSENGYSVRVQTRIVWCRPCGEGWYLSGGEFQSIAGLGE